MSATEIMLERQTANDESALVGAVLVPSGSTVRKDELLFEIENSKAVEEYRAPTAGTLLHGLQAGQTLAFGVTLAQIVPVGEAAPAKALTATAAPAKAPPAEVAPAKAASVKATADAVTAPAAEARAVPDAIRVPARDIEEPRPRKELAVATVIHATISGRARTEPLFSRAAAALVEQYGLSSADFDLDFVTATDVRTRAGVAPAVERTAPPRAELPAVKPATASTFTGSISASAGESEPGEASRPDEKKGTIVSQRKRAEIDALSKGAGSSMLSVLGVRLGRLSIAREPGDLLTDRITDLVLYEASRLLRKDPRLNASFEDGRILLHEAVNGGLAIDRGGQLVVYGIENTDRISAHEIVEEIGGAVSRYMDDKLTVAEMTRATFTVTDLSGEDLDFVFPLLPRGQSLILGITRSAEEGFRIFAGFDHRVTEGREIAIFLGELRDRVSSFSLPQIVQQATAATHCHYCDRSAGETKAKGGERGLLKLVDSSGREVLCCGSCWNGW